MQLGRAVRRSGYAGDRRISLIGVSDDEAREVRRAIQEDGLEVRHPGCSVTLHVKRTPEPRRLWYFAHDPQDEHKCKQRRMSEAHLQLQDHLVKLFRSLGYTAMEEVPLGSQRADVVVEEADVLVDGPAGRWILEVQLSYQGFDRTKERTEAYADVPVLWLFERRPVGATDSATAIHAQLSEDHGRVLVPTTAAALPLDDFVVNVVKGIGRETANVVLEEWVAVDTVLAPVEHKHLFEVLKDAPQRIAKPRCQSLLPNERWITGFFASNWPEDGERDPEFWKGLNAGGGRHPRLLRPVALCYARGNKRWSLDGERIAYEEPVFPSLEALPEVEREAAFEEYRARCLRVRSEWPAEFGWCCPICDVPTSRRGAPALWDKALPFKFEAATGGLGTAAFPHLCGIYGPHCDEPHV